MKALIITVAGSSTRFSRSIGKECLKCIYYEEDFTQSLLYKTVYRDLSFDKYVIVGGYKFDELKRAVDLYLQSVKDKIVLINNEKYAEYGSGYSLYLGLQYVVDGEFDEVVFAEGDLWVDGESFAAVLNSPQDVITFNRDTIDALKSVVFYFDKDNYVHYLYDTAHNSLEIKEPFLSVYNSGQIWKFKHIQRVKDAFYSLGGDKWQGTNLVFIQKYFGEIKNGGFELVEMKKWFMQALIDAQSRGEIPNGEIAAVISSKEGVYALERAARAEIPRFVIARKSFPDSRTMTVALVEKLKELNIDLVVLAGFLTIFTEEIVQAFPNAILNVHPALIPSFCGKGYYGLHVHEKALEYGVKLSGATVHFVSEECDGGPIVLQKAVEVLADDTPESLQQRIMEQCEWKLLPQAVALFCAGKLRVEGRMVHIG